MKSFFKYILLFFLMFPIFIYAETFNESKKIANQYMLNSTYKNSYSKYIITGGAFNYGELLEKDRFNLTVKKNDILSSYLYDGTSFYVSDGSIIGTNEEYVKTKVVEPVKPEVEVTGYGTFRNPWVFTPKYEVTFEPNNNDYGSVSLTPGGNGNLVKFSVYENSQTGTRVYVTPKSGYKYVSTTCKSVAFYGNEFVEGKTYDYLDVKGVTRNVICKANFGIDTFKIKIEYNPVPEYVYLGYGVNWFSDDAGTTIIKKLTNIPYKEGYTYIHTKKDEVLVIDKDGRFINTANKVFNGDGTLVPDFEPNKYVVTFDSNGGNTPVPTKINPTFDGPYGDLATTTRTGYTFKRWYNEDGNTITKDTILKTARDHTLKAEWEAN